MLYWIQRTAALCLQTCLEVVTAVFGSACMAVTHSPTITDSFFQTPCSFSPHDNIITVQSFGHDSVFFFVVVFLNFILPHRFECERTSSYRTVDNLTLYFFFTNRKKELLSRDDLQLPWRPLYDLYDRVVYSKTEHLGLIWFPRYEVLPLHHPDESSLSIVLVYCIYLYLLNWPAVTSHLLRQDKIVEMFVTAAQNSKRRGWKTDLILNKNDKK